MVFVTIYKDPDTYWNYFAYVIIFEINLLKCKIHFKKCTNHKVKLDEYYLSSNYLLLVYKNIIDLYTDLALGDLTKFSY